MVSVVILSPLGKYMGYVVASHNPDSLRLPLHLVPICEQLPFAVFFFQNSLLLNIFDLTFLAASRSDAQMTFAWSLLSDLKVLR